MRDKEEFTYKKHQCVIEFDVEPEECIKAFHFVTKPNGKRILADISPYDWKVSTVKLWIDADYPQRVGVGPLHVEDLQTILEKKNATC